MRLAIEPYAGIGPIKFGMSRDDVRAAVGADVSTFTRTPDSPPIDSFDELGLMAYYKASGECEAVEIAAEPEGARPTLDGQDLLGRPFDELRQFFRQRDDQVKVAADGLTSLKLGVGLHAPAAEEAPDEVVESVIVFERGYYD